ncbi:ShlB/FhaC/HecB family hemolysin secretion/activation protein [Escherichia coli]|nr:ShlB/FhaC/HecB family hemolysin secretion/activation protein [Escherichia coli]
MQRRQTAAWRLGLQHRHYISQATLDAGVSWQREPAGLVLSRHRRKSSVRQRRSVRSCR